MPQASDVVMAQDLGANKLEVVVEHRKLKDLQPSKTNARRMPAVQMDRLVANLTKDGVLSSAPLVYGDRIVSGHHRVEAALKAGIEHADCLVIKGAVEESRITAIQIAHNSIVGQDDPDVLAAMLNDLPAVDRLYSGVNNVIPPEAPSLGPGLGSFPAYTVTVHMIPNEFDAVKAALSAVKDGGHHLIEPSASMTEFLEIVFAVKTKMGKGAMSNPGMLTTMARLAMERLEQLEEDEAGDTEGSTPEKGR